jgi:hypothetical protein
MTSAFFLLTLLSAFADSTPAGPRFGADASVGYTLGHVLGSDFDKRSYGSAVFRLDSFVQDRTTPDPRLGVSLWGSMSIGPSPESLVTTDFGEERSEDIKLSHVGILAVLRQHAEAPFSGTFGIGFGRIDVSTDTLGKSMLPAFTIEAGARYKTSEQSFIDLMARAHWVTRQNPISQQQEEWWLLELATMFGGHVR